MMKYDESQKITALGVVIFSFASVLIMAVVAVLFGAVSALLVLKTNLPESFLKIASVLGGGLGAVIASAFLTAVGKMKGIVSAVIISVAAILAKGIGNSVLDMGGYFNLNGLIGMAFMVLFAFAGSVVGTMMKKR